jgi:uronate dehydrogenase
MRRLSVTDHVHRVAVVGASGLVGSVLREGLRDRYELVCLDRRADRRHGVRRLDARRTRALARALDGCDGVVLLASVAQASAPWRAVYRTNLAVVPSVLEAATRAGAHRVVFASSNHTMTGYEEQEPWASVLAGRHEGLAPATLPLLSVDAPPLPRSAYGASKVFGEAACEWYAATRGLSVTSLRIGTVLTPDRPRQPRHWSTWLSHRDLIAMVDAALQADASSLPRVVWGVSANTWRIWDPHPSYPGYQAQDDAECFERGPQP